MSAFRATLCWIPAVSKFALSKACPSMALNVVVVGLLSTHRSDEHDTVTKAVGSTLVTLGLLVNGLG
jgi:uncharacterized membrane protein